MVYPLKERTYFADTKTAVIFAEMIGKLQHHIVSGYGMDIEKNPEEPYYVETLDDPFRSKDELLRYAGIIA